MASATVIPANAAVPCGWQASSPSYWYAVQTRARHEKKVATQLHRKHIFAFVPTMRQVHRWSDRRKVVEVPLFSGYAFVHAASWRDVHATVVRTPGILRWVGQNGEPSIIPDAQIDAFQRMLTNSILMSRHGFIKIGQRVRVRGGCLDGVEGILVGNSGDSRLVISIDLIQESMSVALQGYDIEPL